MNIDETIKTIERIQERVKKDIHDEEGMEFLQKKWEAYQERDKLIWSDEIVERLKTEPLPEGHKLGLPALDDLTGGFRLQQLITMFAATKHGKSQFAMWMAGVLQHLNPVMLLLEQKPDEVVSQFLERKYDIPKFLTPADQETFVLTDWIEEKVMEGKARFGTQLVIVDHLGYIDNNGKDGKYKRENLAYRIEMTMKEIKGIAKRWNVILILFSHIKEGDDTNPPVLEDLYGSSGIKKESDTVISMWRKNYKEGKVKIYEDKTMLSVLANRRFGKNGNVGLDFNVKTGEYEYNHDWVKEMEEIAKSKSNDF